MSIPIPNFVKADILKLVVKDLTTNPDTQGTVIGAVAAMFIADQIDYGKLVSGDHTQIALAIVATFAAVMGWISNKKHPPQPPVAPAV